MPSRASTCATAMPATSSVAARRRRRAQCVRLRRSAEERVPARSRGGRTARRRYTVALFVSVVSGRRARAGRFGFGVVRGEFVRESVSRRWVEVCGYAVVAILELVTIARLQFVEHVDEVLWIAVPARRHLELVGLAAHQTRDLLVDAVLYPREQEVADLPWPP